MKRVLLLVIASFSIVCCLFLFFNRNAPPTYDIALHLNGEQLVCDGNAAGLDWREVWRKNLDTLIKSEGGKQGSIRTRRLILKLDSDLSYGVFQDLLIESSSRGYINYGVTLGISDAVILFTLYPNAQSRPDGIYTALELLINSKGHGSIDEKSFKTAIQGNPMYLKIVPDDDVSIMQILRPIELLAPKSGQALVEFLATRTRSERNCGKKSATFVWQTRNIEIRHGSEIVVVPDEILEKAEVEESSPKK